MENTCRFCRKEYSNPRSLRRHVQAVHTERLHGCSQCGARFGRSDHLRRHERAHVEIPTEESVAPEMRGQAEIFSLSAGPGEVVPWTAEHNLLLLTPAAVVAIRFSVGWTAEMALRSQRMDPEAIRAARHHQMPTLMRMVDHMRLVQEQLRSEQSEGTGMEQ